MKKEDFLCRDCGFSGKDSLFGSAVQCPQCRSHRIVLADAWQQYKPEEVEQLRAKASENRKES